MKRWCLLLSLVFVWFAFLENAGAEQLVLDADHPAGVAWVENRLVVLALGKESALMYAEPDNGFAAGLLQLQRGTPAIYAIARQDGPHTYWVSVLLDDLLAQQKFGWVWRPIPGAWVEAEVMHKNGIVTPMLLHVGLTESTPVSPDVALDIRKDKWTFEVGGCSQTGRAVVTLDDDFNLGLYLTEASSWGNWQLRWEGSSIELALQVAF